MAKPKVYVTINRRPELGMLPARVMEEKGVIDYETGIIDMSWPPAFVYLVLYPESGVVAHRAGDVTVVDAIDALANLASGGVTGYQASLRPYCSRTLVPVLRRSPNRGFNACLAMRLRVTR